jgi:hypothetical protein
MLQKIKSLFYKQSEIESPTTEVEEAEEQEVEEEILELPDTIEVPWPLVARMKNVEETISKVHEDLKEFFYKNKMTEKRTFDLIAKLEDTSEQEEQKIKKHFNIPDDVQYILEIPNATGRPGLLKKVIQDK